MALAFLIKLSLSYLRVFQLSPFPLSPQCCWWGISEWLWRAGLTAVVTPRRVRDRGTGMGSRTGQSRRASDTNPCPPLRDPSPPTPDLSLATLCSHYGQDGSHACEMLHFYGGLGGALRRKMRVSPDISLPSPIARPHRLSFTLSLSRTGALPEPPPAARRCCPRRGTREAAAVFRGGRGAGGARGWPER